MSARDYEVRGWDSKTSEEWTDTVRAYTAEDAVTQAGLRLRNTDRSIWFVGPSSEIAVKQAVRCGSHSNNPRLQRCGLPDGHDGGHRFADCPNVCANDSPPLWTK